jgi:hypothetical protein
MPTLFRLLTALALIAAVTFAAMAALVYFVEPRQSEIVIEVPLEVLQAPIQTGEQMRLPE